jgi:predicted DNA-binding transcriptional regulator YafY
MRRADRLFQIVQLIRGRRLTTAAFLAQRLEVSERTVYRDVADLQRQGVPIDGEAGVGYRLGAGFDLPPLMFSEGEARALVAATRLAQAWLDPEMARDAELALAKILSALPRDTRAAAESLAVFAPTMAADPAIAGRLQVLRQAAQQHRMLQFDYSDAKGRNSTRCVRPLGCFFWGSVWTMATWCETRQAFRNFRVDRIVDLRVTEQVFRDEPGRTLADFLRAVSRDGGG